MCNKKSAIKCFPKIITVTSINTPFTTSTMHSKSSSLIRSQLTSRRANLLQLLVTHRSRPLYVLYLNFLAVSSHRFFSIFLIYLPIHLHLPITGDIVMGDYLYHMSLQTIHHLPYTHSLFHNFLIKVLLVVSKLTLFVDSGQK